MSVLSRAPGTQDDCRRDVPISYPEHLELAIKPVAYFRFRDFLDPVLAAILLMPAVPMIALLVVIVRLTSPGPGIYRQVRAGKNGQPFTMYKIRTMQKDAEAVTGPVWTKKADERITPVGKVLRKLHLDELPQLFNVLKGNMYLIGPRPERPEFVEALVEQIPGYRDRFIVRPGITGLAQISLPPDDGLDSVCRKLTLDLHYIAIAGPVLDARVFFCTAARLIGVSGETAARLFRLGYDVLKPRYQVHSGKEHDASVRFRTPLEICAAAHNGKDKLHLVVTNTHRGKVEPKSLRIRKPR